MSERWKQLHNELTLPGRAPMVRGALVLELLDERDKLARELKEEEAHCEGQLSNIIHMQRAIEVLNAAVTEYGDYSKHGQTICQALAKAERILKGEE